MKEITNGKRPSVSVVMPVYNVSSYVERCLLSVMKQIYPATECLIIDDASTDDSIDRCQRHIQEYAGPTRFVIIHHDKNRGLSAARNTGTNEATSDFIYNVDSDDELTEDCLESLVTPRIQDDGIEMVMGEFKTDYSDSKCFWKKCLIKNSYFTTDNALALKTNQEIRRWYFEMKEERPDQVWNKLLRLSFVKKNRLYNKEGLLFEDLLWSYYLMRSLNRAIIIHNTTYIHHRRRGSIMTETSPQNWIIHHGQIFKEISEQFVQGERIEEAERWFPDFCLCYIEAADNPDYQFTYKAFLQQFSDEKHHLEIRKLKSVNFFSRNFEGRFLFKGVSKLLKIVKRMVGYLSMQNRYRFEITLGKKT